jgi:hypothetical protein
VNLALLLLCAGVALADVVTLKDGSQVIGDIASGTTREIRIKVDNVEQAIVVDRILSIEFGAVISQTITLPTGTEIKIRTIDKIDSKTAVENQEYAASLDAPVMLAGVTVLPAQTSVFFRATDISNPKFKPASVKLSLSAVMVSGQRIPVETIKLESTGEAQGKKTAKYALIGGATGAVFGFVLGGVHGAKLLGIIGAAGGVLVGGVLHKGVEIPSETRFTYKLSKDAVMTFPAPAPSPVAPAPPPLPVPPPPGQEGSL